MEKYKLMKRILLTGSLCLLGTVIYMTASLDSKIKKLEKGILEFEKDLNKMNSSINKIDTSYVDSSFIGIEQHIDGLVNQTDELGNLVYRFSNTVDSILKDSAYMEKLSRR